MGHLLREFSEWWINIFPCWASVSLSDRTATAAAEAASCPFLCICVCLHVDSLDNNIDQVKNGDFKLLYLRPAHSLKIVKLASHFLSFHSAVLLSPLPVGFIVYIFFSLNLQVTVLELQVRFVFH